MSSVSEASSYLIILQPPTLSYVGEFDLIARRGKKNIEKKYR